MPSGSRRRGPPSGRGREPRLDDPAAGGVDADIGRTMFLSEATVKTHVTRALAKLGLRSRVQAVVLAYGSGFVRPGEATI